MKVPGFQLILRRVKSKELEIETLEINGRKVSVGIRLSDVTMK